MTIIDQLRRAYGEHVKRFGCKPSVINMTVETHGLVAKALREELGVRYWEELGVRYWNVNPYAEMRFLGIPIVPLYEPIELVESVAQFLYFVPQESPRNVGRGKGWAVAATEVDAKRIAAAKDGECVPVADATETCDGKADALADVLAEAQQELGSLWVHYSTDALIAIGRRRKQQNQLAPPKPKRRTWLSRFLHWIAELSPSQPRKPFVKKQRWWRRNGL